KTVDGDLQSISDSFNDSDIRLMRDDTCDVIDGEAGFGERFLRSRKHGDHGLLINIFAGHVDGLKVVVSVFAGYRRLATTSGHEKNVAIIPVASDVSGKYT